MKKTNSKKQLQLTMQTIRALEATQLGAVAGAYDSNIWCPPTLVFGCVPKTPACPI